MALASSPNHDGTQGKSRLYIVSVVAFYIVSTIAMVVVNKHILKGASLPFSFLWGQLAVAAVILQTMGLFGVFKIPRLNLEILRKLAPLIAMNVIGLVLNTLCLTYADAILYQLARSLVLPITVALTPFMMKESVSPLVVGCCAVIFSGFVVGLIGEEIRVSAKGVIFGALSSLSTALHSIVIKQAFSRIEENSPYDMVYYNNLLSALFLFPTLLLEASPLTDMVFTRDAHVVRFLCGTAIAGVMGLIVNFASFLQIKITSPLTHTVASASRGVLQSLASYFLLHEKVNPSRGVGIGVTLTGSLLYSVTKNYEKKRTTHKIVPVKQ